MEHSASWSILPESRLLEPAPSRVRLEPGLHDGVPITLAPSRTSLTSELSPGVVEANRLSRPEDFRPISSRVEMMGRGPRGHVCLYGRSSLSGIMADRRQEPREPHAAPGFRGRGVGPVRHSTEVWLDLSRQGVSAGVGLLYTSVGGGAWTPPTCGTFDCIMIEPGRARLFEPARSEQVLGALPQSLVAHDSMRF